MAAIVFGLFFQSAYGVGKLAQGIKMPRRVPNLARENLVLFKSPRVSAEGTLAVDFDFSESAQGFTGCFADLPADFDPEFYQLVGEHRSLPSELGSGEGLYLSGAKRSDDLLLPVTIIAGDFFMIICGDEGWFCVIWARVAFQLRAGIGSKEAGWAGGP